MDITISNEDLRYLEEHAEDHMPIESCAVLLGRDGRVSEVVLADNEARSATRFAIPAGQLIEIYRKAEKSGTEVVGIFHSHPESEARPSETDAEFMRINPVVWVIYSCSDRVFRAYELGQGVSEVRIYSE